LSLAGGTPAPEGGNPGADVFRAIDIVEKQLFFRFRTRAAFISRAPSKKKGNAEKHSLHRVGLSMDI